MSKKTLFFILGGFGLYLFSAGISYATFSYVLKVPSRRVAYKPPTLPSALTKDGALTFDENLPKTEPCPLSGALYPEVQREWWEKHRPLGVMLENHRQARPQSGLSAADVIYEAVAEGGITRFLAVYHCQDAGVIGPVRSARTYFVDLISEYSKYPLYAHVGGANTPGPANALGQIESFGWNAYNDLNQFSIGFPTFWRDYERLGHPVATEHTMYATTAKLWKVAKDRGLTEVDKEGKPWDKDFRQWKFKDDAKLSDRVDAQTITFSFWEGYSDYEVKWVYDKTLNVYKRENGGESHKDKNNDREHQARNVVIVFMTERNANDGYENNIHLLYGTKGSGKAMVFFDGRKTEGIWEKKERIGRMVFLDGRGNEIKFNRGQIWIAVLPIGNKVTVE